MNIKSLYSKKDKAHNWHHILRIRKIANIIKKDYKNIDEDLLKFLIKFHGLKDYVKDNKNMFSKQHINSLLRHNSNPKKIEEKIVHDANLIDNLGIQGIKKAFIVGKKLNRPKKDTIKFMKKSLKDIKFYTRKGKAIGKEELKIIELFINSQK